MSETAKDVMLIDHSEPASDAAQGPRKRFLTPLICSVVAATGILGGFLALFIGLVLIVAAAALGDRSYDKAGTILLIAAIPGILTGSIFLDEIRDFR